MKKYTCKEIGKEYSITRIGKKFKVATYTREKEFKTLDEARYWLGHIMPHLISFKFDEFNIRRNQRKAKAARVKIYSLDLLA